MFLVSKYTRRRPFYVITDTKKVKGAFQDQIMSIQDTKMKETTISGK